MLGLWNYGPVVPSTRLHGKEIGQSRVERGNVLNRPLRTCTVGGMGRDGQKALPTPLDLDLRNGATRLLANKADSVHECVNFRIARRCRSWCGVAESNCKPERLAAGFSAQ